MGKGRKPVILSKGQMKISSFFVKQNQQAQSILSDISSTNLSNQNTADICPKVHISASIFENDDVKSPDKPSSLEVVRSHDELSFPKERKNSVDENCDVIYPTPKKSSPVKRKVLNEVGSPDTIPTTPTTESRKIDIARQNKKHSKLGMLKFRKHFSDKRNKQGISLIDLLDNASSADGTEDRVFSVSNPVLQNQDAFPHKKIKLNGVTEDGQSSHGTNMQVCSEKSIVNESLAKDANQDCITRTNVQDRTELDSLLQLPAAFSENSILCNPDASGDIVPDRCVTKTDVLQYEDLNEPKQCTNVTDGTVCSNKIVCSDVLHLNSNCGSVGSSNKVSGCDILSGKDRNQETEIVCNSTVLTKQAAFKESSFKPVLTNLEAKCSDCSAESSDQCAEALCGNEQTAAGMSTVQQMKTASCSSHLTEEDHTAWLSFDSSDFFMIQDEETESAVSENYEELSLDTFQRCEVMELKTGNNKQEKIVKLCSTHSKATTVCLLQDYWSDINLEKGDIVSIKASPCEKTSHSTASWFINNSVGLLVPHPDTLISSTAVVGSLFCPRRGVLSEWFRGIDGDSTIMVIGSLVHELLQEVLKNNLSTLSAIKNVVQELLSRSHCIQMLYSAHMSKEDALKALEGFVPRIANFINTHVQDLSHKTATPTPAPPKGKNKNVNNAEKWDGTISAICDIEENIWAPRLGIKGKVDVTVEVKINRHKKTLTKVMPLELKTGRSSFSAEHKGQVILYTMMMSELGNNVDSGLLLYLRDGMMQEVKSGNNECRDLILLRNNLAYFITRIPALMDHGVGFKPPQLPEPINHRSACAKCPYLTLCSSFLGEFGKDVEGILTFVRGDHRNQQNTVMRMSSLQAKSQAQDLLYLKRECHPLDHDIWRDGLSALSASHPLAEIAVSATSHLSASHIDYLIHWTALLLLEDSYTSGPVHQKDLWCLDPEQRERRGKCLWSMVITGTVMRIGDSYIHTLRKHCDQFSDLPKSGFTVGEYVSVSTDNRLAVATGTICDITQSTLTLSLNRDITKYGSSSSFHIDMYMVQQGKVFNLTNLGCLMDSTDTAAKLRRLIIDKERPTFVERLKSSILPASHPVLQPLNVCQRRAVLKALTANDYILIKGMPGTGKTATIVSLVEILVKLGQTVLVTSHTHSAVDNVLLKLAARNVDFLRLGSSGRIHPQLRSKSEANLTENVASPAELEALYNGKPVVGTTCLGAGHPLFAQRMFDVCVVDESTQVLQVAVLRSLFCAKKFVLIGDPEQLPPVIRSKTAREMGMSESLFARLDCCDATLCLDVQYRMNEAITNVANALTYNGQLKCGNQQVSNATLQLPALHMVTKELESEIWLCPVLSAAVSDSVLVLDTGPVWRKYEDMSTSVSLSPNLVSENNDERQESSIGNNDGLTCRELGKVIKEMSSEERTCTNLCEAALIQHIIVVLMKGGVKGSSIGVIAPFRAQVALLRKIVASNVHEDVEVNTIDQYQGRDKDVIIFSCTKTENITSASTKSLTAKNKENEILEDKRRLTVAITRAKHKLLIIGDMKYLHRYQPFQCLFDCLSSEQVIELSDGNRNFEWDQLMRNMVSIDDTCLL